MQSTPIYKPPKMLQISPQLGNNTATVVKVSLENSPRDSKAIGTSALWGLQLRYKG